MKKLLIPFIAILTTVCISCNKTSSPSPDDDDFPQLEQQVITDFTNNVALNSYLTLNIEAGKLNASLESLNTNASQAKLEEARNNWKSMRKVWEQSESFLFGPVEDNDYDPNMDTWPTDYTQMDSLLASSNPLEVSDLENLTLSLRGYHPIEYIIFGDHGDREAGEITERQKKYMLSLSTDLVNTCNKLYLSWTSAPVNFADEVINAGKGSSRYAKRQEVFMAIVDGLIGICEEVGEGKMKEPFDARDPQLVESPYSGNSTTDFQNNIIGIRNVYMGLNGGKGLKDLVAARNKSLDSKLQSRISAAINSFDNITLFYEEAIIDQRTQIQQTMDALETLKTTLEEEVKPFVQQFILD